MALTTLTVDLNARLASFEQNLAKSVSIAQANASKLEKSFAGVSNTLKGLGAGIGIAVIANIAKSAITSAAALHDFSEQTGATVENLSKLEQVAALSGTGIETVVEAIQKLSINLGKSDDEGHGAARALKAIGLEASKLRSIDPVEAFKQAAFALDKYADSGTKVAVANALIRGDGPRLLSFMKDLAEAGDVAAVVSGKQGAEADKLTKQLAALGQQFKNTASVATFEFLDAIKDIDDQLRIGIETFDGFYTALARIGLSSPFSDAEEKIDSLTGKIAAAKQDQIDNPLFAKLTFSDTNIAALEQELSYYEKIVAAKRDRNKEDLPGLAKPDIEFKPDGKAARPGKPDDYFTGVFEDSIKALQEFKDKYDATIASLLSGTDQGMIDALAKDLEKISSALKAGEIDDGQFRAVAAQIEKQYHALIPANAELERLNELLSNTPSAALEKTRQDMLLLAAAFESGRLNAEQYFEAVNVSLGTVDSAPAVKELTAVGIAIQSIAADAASAFTDLLFEGKNTFADLAKFALKELAKIVLFQSVFGPLASGISGAFGGPGGSFLGGIEAFQKRASGGPVSAGSPYLIGEAGAELFIPRSAGVVIPNKAIARGSTINNVSVSVNAQGAPVSERR